MSRNTNNNNTNPEFMPKRNRPESIDVDDEFSDSSAPATQTPAAASAANVSGGDASSHPVTGADPHLERILSGLDIDADFKDSIRSMTPETRRDILNDIVRSQQHQESQTAMQQYMHTMVPPMFQGARTATMSNANPFQFSLAASLAAAAAGRGLGGDDTEPEFHYTLDIGENDMDEDEDEDEEFDGEEDSDEQNSQRAAAFTNFLRQLHQHGGGFPFQFLEQHLMNMRSELAQMRAMRDMGINRDIDDMSYEELLALEERMGNVSKGIASEATMQSCMTIAESAPKEGSCAVCLEEFSTPGAAQVCASLRNCGHHFHESCLKQWLGMEKTCPVCKQEVLPASSSSAPA